MKTFSPFLSLRICISDRDPRSDCHKSRLDPNRERRRKTRSNQFAFFKSIHRSKRANTIRKRGGELRTWKTSQFFTDAPSLSENCTIMDLSTTPLSLSFFYPSFCSPCFPTAATQFGLRMGHAEMKYSTDPGRENNGKRGLRGARYRIQLHYTRYSTAVYVLNWQHASIAWQ